MNSIFKTLQQVILIKKEKNSKVLNRDELYLAGSADPVSYTHLRAHET